MDLLTIEGDRVAPRGCVRDTVITHSRLAWRHERAQAAVASHHGLHALPIEGLAARLAGGFLQPIDPDALKAAVTKALSADLGNLNRIKELPGFPRAAAATLSKAWTAGLNLAELAATAGPEAASRLVAVARLEAEVIRHLPPLSDLRAGHRRLNAIEVAERPPIAGKCVLHLQCHFGADSLTLV
jgi:hypothetical protein